MIQKRLPTLLLKTSNTKKNIYIKESHNELGAKILKEWERDKQGVLREMGQGETVAVQSNFKRLKAGAFGG